MTAAAITPQTVAALVLAGEVRAREHGGAEPTLEAVAWELLLEAADTLRRLPDRERGWLAACDRSAWPPVLIEAAERWANAVASGGWEDMRVAKGPPSAAAIQRMDLLFALTAGFPRPLDLRRAFGLASGVPARLIARQTRCHRRTVYVARDRVAALLAARFDQMLRKKAA